MESELTFTLPTVDLSPFLLQDNNEAGKKMAMETVALACRTYGFFRIVNHGVPLTLMKEAIELSKEFFSQSYEEKFKFSPVAGSNSESLVPAGFAQQPENSGNKSEYFMVFKPELGFNVYPTRPPEFRSTLDQCFSQLSKTALLVESMLTNCMGLPPNFISNYDKDRNSDFMVALHYFPMTDDCGTENNGLSAHQDGDCITMVFQDDVGGLEVLKDGEWISADPSEGSIIVNVGDIIQVLTNNSFTSAMHRIVRKERDRYSYAFFFNSDGGKWIEPLPQFTSKIGVAPKYRGFWYKEYIEQRMKNISIPASRRAQELFDISRYAI